MRLLILKFIFILFFLSNLSAKNTIEFIIVNKEARNIIVYNKGKAIKKFNISLGFEPLGTKVKRGDGKTPEGLYFVEEKIRNSSFYLALKISYPNPWDIRRALTLDYHPGGQIMIHGTPNLDYDENYHNPENDWTEGCIAVSNKNISYLWKNILKGTPVLIRK